ncbi:9494_t:CDS:2 [Entrophospora sp. SA101]|nr:9494_t:CDS:2 [Entrophospora sp. SA101]
MDRSYINYRGLLTYIEMTGFTFKKYKNTPFTRPIIFRILRILQLLHALACLSIAQFVMFSNYAKTQNLKISNYFNEIGISGSGDSNKVPLTTAENRRNLEISKTLPNRIIINSFSIDNNSNTNINSNKEELKSLISFRVGLLGLIEYNDTITLSESTSYYSLIGKGGLWSGIEISSEGDNIKKFETSLIDNTKGQNLIVNIIGFITGNATRNSEGILLRPSRLKYTLSFKNFPYIYKDSKIAILHAIYSSSTSTKKYDLTSVNILEAGRNCGGGRDIINVGKFESISTVLADGKKYDLLLEQKVIWKESIELISNINHVNNNINNEGDDQYIINANNGNININDELFELIAFKIPVIQPTEVIWDPEVGIDDPNDYYYNENNDDDGKSSNAVNGKAVNAVLEKSCYASYATIDHDYPEVIKTEDGNNEPAPVPSWIEHTCIADLITILLILANTTLFIVTFFSSIFVLRKAKNKDLLEIYNEQNDENEFDVGELAVDDAVIVEECQNMRNIESRYSAVDENWLKRIVVDSK